METLPEPHIGFAMLPKRTVNVKTCELLRFARVTPDFVHTVSVGATRARLDLFQDDLYPPCVTGQPCAGMQDYVSGAAVPELPRQSLRPEGMQVCVLEARGVSQPRVMYCSCCRRSRLFEAVTAEGVTCDV